MNYFFLAAAFFAFHLLLAYLVDHVSIHLAFAICSLVSIFLVVSYLRLVVGIRFAAVEAGLAQFVFLVLFSFAFFYKGFTGLAITIGSILTLFVVMQMTGRIQWKIAAISESLRLREEQRSAADLPLFEGCMGLRGIGQRIRAIDPDGNLPLLYPGHKPLEVLRDLLDVRKAVRARKKQ
jgi:hypothetical protein